VEQEAGPLLVDTQSTKCKRAEGLDERPTELHEKKRKLRSTVVSEPGQIKANGPKFSSLETELHDLIFEELEIKDVLSLSLTNRYIWSVGRSQGRWLSHGPSQGSGAPDPCLLFLQILAS
jgi:hypothetical protein